MEPRSESIRVRLPNGQVARVEATVLDGDATMAAQGIDIPDLSVVMQAIEGVSQAFTEAMSRVKPDKASVTFGVEVAVETGQLVGLFVKGSGTGNLAVTLEWSGGAPSSLGDSGRGNPSLE